MLKVELFGICSNEEITIYRVADSFDSEATGFFFNPKSNWHKKEILTCGDCLETAKNLGKEAASHLEGRFAADTPLIKSRFKKFRIVCSLKRILAIHWQS